MMDWLKRHDLPNKLSLSRIVVVPVLIALMAKRESNWAALAACALFILASVTDYVDGYLARRLKSESQMGKLLDPLADKLLVLSVLVMALAHGDVHYIYVLLLIGREFAVTSLRGIATEEGVVIAASPMAKYKTATQFVALAGIIIGPDNLVFGLDLFMIGQVFLVISTFMALVSGYHYFAAYRVGAMK